MTKSKSPVLEPLRAALNARKETDSEIAKAIGCSHQTVRGFKSGYSRSLRQETLDSLATFLGMSVQED